MQIMVVVLLSMTDFSDYLNSWPVLFCKVIKRVIRCNLLVEVFADHRFGWMYE